MITATDLTGILTAEQYTLLKSVIDSSDVAPTLRVKLRQYAPVWGRATDTTEMPALAYILDPQHLHTATPTAQGNWRLGYDGTNSDIYWPFQVRSLDAISLTDYDIIAMVTDLPPIVDTSTSEKKSSFSYTRVQGIVLWKYDRTTGQWSDHWTWDVCDSTQDEARANVKLTSDGDYVYMTYGKSYGGITGLAITRSTDGIHWEDPILYDAEPGGSMPLLTALARSGNHMYLVSELAWLASVSTDYMGTTAAAAIQDITDYVLSVSLNQGAARSLTVELANPDNVLASFGLLALNVSVRLSLEAGYQIAEVVDGETVYTDVYVPIIVGDVTEWTTTEQMPVQHLSLQVKDSLSLMDVVGSSEAVEWQGLQTDGDDYCPINADDKTGATGLSKSIIKGGSWTGTQNGVKFECDGRERILLSTMESRAFNGCVSSEWSFYLPVAPINMAQGGSGTDTATGTEYAGIVFRYLDEHNLWYVKVTYDGHVSLVQRVEDPTNEHLHVRDYVPTTQAEYADMHIDTVHATATITLDEDYWDYYSSRITVEWRYGLVKVFYNYPGAAPTLLISHEVPGFGDTPYTNQATPIVAGYMGHLVYSAMDGTLELAENGDAQNGTQHWHAENLDDEQVTVVTSPVREGGSDKVIQVQTQPFRDNPGVFYKIGSLYNPLNLPGGPHLEWSVYCYLAGGDADVPGKNDAAIRMKAKCYYTSDPDTRPDQKSSTDWVTAFSSWTEFAWSMDTKAGKTIRRFELQFIDQRGAAYRSGVTTFVVADLHIKQTVDKAYWYLGERGFLRCRTSQHGP
jgi:hypothetical protein